MKCTAKADSAGVTTFTMILSVTVPTQDLKNALLHFCIESTILLLGKSELLNVCRLILNIIIGYLLGIEIAIVIMVLICYMVLTGLTSKGPRLAIPLMQISLMHEEHGSSGDLNLPETPIVARQKRRSPTRSGDQGTSP